MKRVFLAAAALLIAGGLFAGGRNEKPAGTGPAMKAMVSATPNKVMFTTMEDAQALAAKGPTVLFFSADWCPSCQAANRDLDANGKDLGDVTVVVVNYDVEKDLKNRYGVTYQHTFVQIDTAGKELAKWSGGGVSEIVEKVRR